MSPARGANNATGPEHLADGGEAALASVERYRLFYQHARDIALFVRPDGRIAEVNDAAVAAYGYTREELLARTVYDLRRRRGCPRSPSGSRRPTAAASPSRRRTAARTAAPSPSRSARAGPTWRASACC